MGFNKFLSIDDLQFQAFIILIPNLKPHTNIKFGINIENLKLIINEHRNCGIRTYCGSIGLKPKD